MKLLSLFHPFVPLSVLISTNYSVHQFISMQNGLILEFLVVDIFSSEFPTVLFPNNILPLTSCTHSRCVSIFRLPSCCFLIKGNCSSSNLDNLILFSRLTKSKERRNILKSQFFFVENGDFGFVRF